MKRRLISCMVAAAVALAAIPAGMTSSPQKVFACSKGEFTTPEYDYSVASQVFSGTATKVDNVYYHGELFRMATFVVDTNFKGAYTRTVLTRADSDVCGYEFEPGRNYLVFANHRLGYPAAGVFDVFTGEEAQHRIELLKELNHNVPVPDPGEQTVTLYPGWDAKVTLNGKEVPVKPGKLFYKNILYVPLTFFRDTLGYVTVWNAEAKRYDIYLRSEWAGIAAQGDLTQSEFKPNTGIPAGTDAFEASVSYSDVQAKVDGSMYAPEHLPFNYNGVVFVPLRDTAEKLGIQVEWDAGSYIAQMKDTRPIDPNDHPALVMKLASSQEGEPDLIIDRIENDQALYRIDRPLAYYGETQEQRSAPFLDLVKGRSIQLYLKTGDRENELVMTELLHDALLTRPEVRTSISLTLNRDFYSWPADRVISTSNIH